MNRSLKCDICERKVTAVTNVDDLKVCNSCYEKVFIRLNYKEKCITKLTTENNCSKAQYKRLLNKSKEENKQLKDQLKHYTEPRSVEWEDFATRVCPYCKQKSYYCASRDEEFIKQPDNYCSNCGQKFKIE